MLKKTTLYAALLLMIMTSGSCDRSSNDQANSSQREEETASTNLSELMEEAYAKFKKAFVEKNIPTTPAYDVVGLFGALVPDSLKEEWFDISSEDSSQKDACTYELKGSKRAPEMLAESFEVLKTHLSGTYKVKLAIITDFGEETDDEVTLIMADILRKSGLISDARFLFTTKKERFSEQKAKFKGWGGDGNLVLSLHEKEDRESFVKFLNDTSYTLEQPRYPIPIHPISTYFGSYKPKTVLLQIGPIHDKQLPGEKWRPKLTEGLYDYVLVGTLGDTLNSKKDGRAPAEYFLAKANKKIIVDTMRGKGAFKFSYAALNKVLSGHSGKDKLIDHVCKIGWRNTVGRASPYGGRFIAHLVAKDAGANYMTIKAMNKALGGGELKAPKGGKAEKLARKYLNSLKKSKNALTVDENGVTNKEVNGTEILAQSIVDGYAEILEFLKQKFGVPYVFLESGSEENWNPQWENGNFKAGNLDY